VLPGEWPDATPRTADYFAELTNMLVDRRSGLRDEHRVMIENRSDLGKKKFAVAS
jgi:hypothetical protein